jgi:membrane associated rhomboid family serine protease
MTHTARATLTLIAINLMVYFVMLVGWLMTGFYPKLLPALTDSLALSSEPWDLLSSPWTILTYMFTHVNFVHLTVNMLWLIGFCPMMKGNWAASFATYIAGGIVGGITFVYYTVISDEPRNELVGASAAVISVIIAATCLAPNRKLQMILIGEVKLKWLALFALLTLFAFSNALSAETAAHIGGALTGLILGLLLRKRDKSISENALTCARQHTRQLSLLQKAERSGFNSLSEQERLELFNLHNSHTRAESK